MSIVRLRKVFKKPIMIHLGRRSLRLGTPLAIIFWGIVIIFVFGAAFSFGLTRVGRMAQSRLNPGQPERRITPVVAQVDGYTIDRQTFEQRFAELTSRQSGNLPLGEEALARYQVLQGMIEQHLLENAARAEAISVSDAEVDARINEQVASSIQRRFPDQKRLYTFLKEKRLSYEQYRGQLRATLDQNREGLREQLVLEKLEAKVRGQAAVTEQTVKQEYDEVKARHILIRPKPPAASAQQPATATPAPSPESAQQTAKDQARALAEKLLAQIKQGGDFAKLARQHSDDPGSAPQGGELGWFGRHAMDARFEQAAFALQPGQVSGVVESPFGFHIIQVEARRSNLPKDFEKNKQQYMQQQKATLETQAWEDYRSKLKQQAQIQIQDPELQALALLTQGRQEEAVALLQQAVENDPENVTARYTLAQFYTQRGDKQQATTYFRQVVEKQQGASSPEAHLALGKLLREAGQKDEARREFKNASDWASALQFQNYYTHLELKKIYQELKDAAGVAQEQTWLAEFNQAQQESMGGGAMGLPVTVP